MDMREKKILIWHYVALPGGGHAGVPARHRRPGPLAGGSCSFGGTNAASVVGGRFLAQVLAFFSVATTGYWNAAAGSLA
jgi:hypothetical protein